MQRLRASVKDGPKGLFSPGLQKLNSKQLKLSCNSSGRENASMHFAVRVEMEESEK